MRTFLRCSAVALSTLLIASPLQALPVYINEFHYDNQGADQNEFVEIAGQSGASLEGWQLEFYNGGNGRRYMTWDLLGNFSDQGAGFGVLAFSGGQGIQNGGSDGIALVNDLGELVQFISYEGSLVASSGTALGLSSIDIGVAESPSTPAGSSLQLTGEGRSSDDFSWVVGQASMGTLNVAQSYLPMMVVPLAPVLPEPVSPDTHSTPVLVPEPAGIGLLGFGMLLLGMLRRKPGQIPGFA